MKIFTAKDKWPLRRLAEFRPTRGDYRMANRLTGERIAWASQIRDCSGGRVRRRIEPFKTPLFQIGD